MLVVVVMEAEADAWRLLRSVKSEQSEQTGLRRRGVALKKQALKWSVQRKGE